MILQFMEEYDLAMTLEKLYTVTVCDVQKTRRPIGEDYIIK